MTTTIKNTIDTFVNFIAEKSINLINTKKGSVLSSDERSKHNLSVAELSQALPPELTCFEMKLKMEDMVAFHLAKQENPDTAEPVKAIMICKAKLDVDSTKKHLTDLLK